MPHDPQTPQIPQTIGVWDGISIIVGIVVGATIFKASPTVFASVPSAGIGLAAWIIGGALSLVGALCYAELATTYPRSGGEYVYLSRAYGPLVGFLFGWTNLVAILSGSIGALAYVFADYALALFGRDASAGVWFALAAVVALTATNMVGVGAGKSTQNLLTVAKVVGLAMIPIAGAFGRLTGQQLPQTPAAAPSGGGYGLAMILVLYAYGGWNDAAYVAAEIRDGKRTIPRALLGGIGLVTLLYLIVNAGYLWGLGFEGLGASTTPAADTLGLVLGRRGAQAMSLLVIISALSGLNGLIFTGSRVHATMGEDHGLLRWLARWHPRRGTPACSLAVQGLVSLLMIAAVGTAGGRRILDATLALVGLNPLPWQRYGGGFETLVAGTAPAFWLFFLLSGLAIFVLRRKDPERERPFRLPLYPLTPLLFAGTSLYMLYSSLVYAKTLALILAVPITLALPLYAWSQARDVRSQR